MKTRRIITTLVAVGALAVPAQAMAQSSPLVDQYAGQGPSVENQITPPAQVEATVVSKQKSSSPTVAPQAAAAPTAAAQPQSSSGSLPFTGLDARLLVLVGIALASIGFATRRLARRID